MLTVDACLAFSDDSEVSGWEIFSNTVRLKCFSQCLSACLICVQIAGSSTLLRFLRSCVAAGMIGASKQQFMNACGYLLASGTAVHAELPQEMSELIVGENRHVRMLWRDKYQQWINLELRQTQSERQQAMKQIESERQQAEQQEAESAELLSKLKALVQAKSGSVQPAVHPSQATLLSIHAVVHLDQKPADADRAAVWDEFQWVRTLCTALRGGADTFKGWFEDMTDIEATGQAGASGSSSAAVREVSPLWRRLDSEFHSIRRARCSPDEFIGGRLQSRSAESGKWQDGEDGALAFGPRRVLVTYQSVEAEACDGTFDGFAGLLVKLPVVPINLPKDKDEVGQHPLQLHDEHGKQRCVKLDGKEVHYMNIVLTVPRLHLLKLIAISFVRKTQGVLLQGLHGAGKSAMLKALVSILVVGGETEMMYAANSRELTSLDMTELLKAALYGSGHLVKQLLSGEYSPDKSNKHWALLDDGSFTQMWRKLLSCEGTMDGMGDAVRVECAETVLYKMEYAECRGGSHVVIIDEVNELLDAIDYHGQHKADKSDEKRPPAACSAFWKAWLPWKKYGTPGCFRVLASSPHGKREDSELLAVAAPEFELRAAPADQLAAVLLCAPEFLGSSVAGAAARFHLTPSASLHIRESLGSNARFIAAFLREHSSSFQTTSPLDISSAIRSRLAECVDFLYKRFVKALKDEGGGDANRPSGPRPTAASTSSGADAAQQHPYVDAHINIFQLAIKDASLVVRNTAQARGAPTILAGVPALQTVVRAVGRDPFLGVKLLRNMQSDDFETGMAVAMSVGAAAKQMWPLPMLLKSTSAETQRKQHAKDGKDRGHGVLNWPDSGTVESSADTDLLNIYSSFDQKAASEEKRSSQPVSILCGQFILPVKQLFSADINAAAQRVVFQTVPSFPGIDAVCIDKVNNAVEVTFWEVTTSTLVNHATGRKPVPCLVPKYGTANESVKGKVQVKPALRGVLATMGVRRRQRILHEAHPQTVRLSTVEGNTAVCTQDNLMDMYDSAASGTCVANCLLAALGVPIIVKCRLVAKDPSAEGQGSGQPASNEDCSTVHCRMELRTELSEDLCNELHGGDSWKPAHVTSWSFRMVYASQTQLGDNLVDAYEDLKADFIYGVFNEDLWC